MCELSSICVLFFGSSDKLDLVVGAFEMDLVRINVKLGIWHVIDFCFLMQAISLAFLIIIYIYYMSKLFHCVKCFLLTKIEDVNNGLFICTPESRSFYV